MFLILISIACALDCQRRRTRFWTDECFPIPVDGDARRRQGIRFDGVAPVLANTNKARRSGACMSFCNDATSGACRDALDDLMSNYFKFFGNARSIIDDNYKSVNGVLSETTHGSGFAVLLQAFAASTITRNANRQVCASLGVHLDDVEFLRNPNTQNEIYGADDAQEDNDACGPDGVPQTSPFSCNYKQPWLKKLATSSIGINKRLEYLQKVNRAFNKDRHEHIDSHRSWLACPKMVWRIFWSQGPIGMVLVDSILMSSSMRALFLFLDVLGSFLCMTIFFSVSGSAPSNTNKSICDLEHGFWHSIGRLIVVATVSALVSGLPLSFLRSLHSRSFKRVSSEGSPEWKRQLRAWRVQDRTIWVLGLAYGSFALNFLVLFLANVALSAHFEWITSAFVYFFENNILFPFLASVLFPTIALMWLAMLSRYHQRHKKSRYRNSHIFQRDRGAEAGQGTHSCAATA